MRCRLRLSRAVFLMQGNDECPMLGIELGNKGRAVRLIRQCEDQFGRQKEDDEGKGQPGS